MDDEAATQGAGWVQALPLEKLRQSGSLAARLNGRQVALFLHEGAVLACNNRCPHEGYPLCEGSLDAGGVLTCQWHNWKFDLHNGANLYGGDALRTYPARVVEGQVWVDMSEPAPHVLAARAQTQLDDAMLENDAPRIARELARLERAGASPQAAVLHALQRSHEQLRYGMTHAYAAADAWLRLRELLADKAQRLACATEALAHIAFDTLREPRFPYAVHQHPWQAAAFLAALEAQDEEGAMARLNGAFGQGLGFAALEPTLAEAALAHYSDFGHSLIYLGHIRSLVANLGPEASPPLLHSWVRSLIHATREDLLPDFKAYGPALAQWPRNQGAARLQDAPSPANFESLPIRQTLSAAVEAAATHTPQALWNALMRAGAHHLLRFDEHHALRTDNPATEQVGWLDFSHALTFGHAVRITCERWPALWPQGLLQMALFVGRNTPYLESGTTTESALAAWLVEDPKSFDAQAPSQIIDHGLGLPIFAVHRLKTWLAVRDILALGAPPSTADSLRAAVRRLLWARFKERHALRAATQALRFVERE